MQSFRSLALIIALSTALSLAGCAKERQAGANPEAEGAKAKGAAGESPAAATGVLSEEGFKALHQLKTEPAPPARGTMIEIAGERAYLTLPEGAKPPLPGIVVIHEWWGLNDHIKHWSDRLAADGYAAIAVDLYRGHVADNPDSAMTYMRSVDTNRAIEIMKAADAFLASDPRIMAPRRGSIGWCFGGGKSLQLALNAPDLNAAVIYYGLPLVTDPAQLKSIKAAILGNFGNKDQAIPPKMVDQFEAALKTAGVEHEIYRYDADHAFANPSRDSYHEADAAKAWQRTRTFLAKHLKAAK